MNSPAARFVVRVTSAVGCVGGRLPERSYCHGRGRPGRPNRCRSRPRRSRAADRSLLRVTGTLIGGRTGRRQRRDRRPRRRDAGRARHARRPGRGARAHLGDGDDAQLQEAEANAAQIEARLGLASGDVVRPEARARSQNAKASLELAEASSIASSSLLDQKVVSQTEYDQRRTQMEAARQQYQVAKNGRAAVISRSRRRAPASRSRARRSPIPSSARRSPASSPSGSSASATTSPRARRSRRSSASIRCAWS